jgi:hypothetical protein
LGANLLQGNTTHAETEGRISFGNWRVVDTFQMKASDNRHGANRYLYPIDLDADGNEELIVAGFENQPNTPKEYTDTLIHVFGWRNGVFQNITASWLPGDMNKVQGVGDIAFGDFNGDGKTDAYLSAYTDMHHEVNSFVLMNNGASFSREILEKAAWQHGVAVIPPKNGCVEN